MITLTGNEYVNDVSRADLLIAIWFIGSGPKVDIPIIRWWIGSDVLSGEKGNATHNWAVAPWLVDELKERGIQSQELPILPIREPRLMALPKSPVVLTYQPKGSESLYGYDDLLKVAGAFPHITFNVLQRSGVPPLKNITFLGTIPHEQMPGIYADTSLILRLTRHDGLSLSVLEGLSFGRQVIWTYPIGAAYYCETVDDVIETMKSIDHNQLNTVGVGYMRYFRNETIQKMTNLLLGIK